MVDPALSEPCSEVGSIPFSAIWLFAAWLISSRCSMPRQTLHLANAGPRDDVIFQALLDLETS